MAVVFGDLSSSNGDAYRSIDATAGDHYHPFVVVVVVVVARYQLTLIDVFDD